MLRPSVATWLSCEKKESSSKLMDYSGLPDRLVKAVTANAQSARCLLQQRRLSAAVKQPAYRYVQGGTGSITAAHDHDNIGVTADGEVVVGRRRSHRADVSRPHRQCPGRPPCPWLGPPWSLVP